MKRQNLKILRGFGRWIRIRVKVKSCIRIRIKVKKLQKLKLEPWRPVNAHNEGLEAQNEVMEGLKTSGRR